MELYDWLLFLHVLAAFLLVGGLTALWALLLATRPAAQGLPAQAMTSFGGLMGALVAAGMMGTLVFGIWLAIDHDRYEIYDGWILAALALWLVGGFSGDRAGRALRADPVEGRAAGTRFHAISTVAALAILVLMIWKPGA